VFSWRRGKGSFPSWTRAVREHGEITELVRRCPPTHNPPCEEYHWNLLQRSVRGKVHVRRRPVPVRNSATYFSAQTTASTPLSQRDYPDQPTTHGLLTHCLLHCLPRYLPPCVPAPCLQLTVGPRLSLHWTTCAESLSRRKDTLGDRGRPTTLDPQPHELQHSLTVLTCSWGDGRPRLLSSRPTEWTWTWASSILSLTLVSGGCSLWLPWASAIDQVPRSKLVSLCLKIYWLELTINFSRVLVSSKSRILLRLYSSSI